MRPLFLLSALLLLASCAAGPTAPQPRQFVLVEDSQFEPAVRFLGVQSVQRQQGFQAPVDNTISFNIRSFVPRTGPSNQRIHQLYVLINYSDFNWRFYDSGRDQDARELPFTRIDRQVLTCAGSTAGRGCLYSEIFGLTLTEADLRRAMNQGQDYCVQARGRGARTVLCLTPGMIRAQFDEIDTWLSRQPVAPTSTQPHTTQPFRAPGQPTQPHQ
jgi:hypothetical protein